MGTLSGGEKQRAALDSKNRDLLMEIITELNQQKTTVIIVTHDPEAAKRCTKNLFMNGGRFSEQVRI